MFIIMKEACHLCLLQRRRRGLCVYYSKGGVASVTVTVEVWPLYLMIFFSYRFAAHLMSGVMEYKAMLDRYAVTHLCKSNLLTQKIITRE